MRHVVVTTALAIIAAGPAHGAPPKTAASKVVVVLEFRGNTEGAISREQLIILSDQARKGTLVVLHGLLPHASAPNRSDRPRHAYALHLIDGRAYYPADNWLQRKELPLRGFA